MKDHIAKLSMLLLLALIVPACGSGSPANPTPVPGLTGQHQPDTNGTTPTVAELQELLLSELNRLGVDPEKVAAAAPTDGSEVIDLVASPIDPDGSGPETATGYRLEWTERLTGDYDQNGEVNIADVSTLPLRWQQTVLYEDPLLHEGFASYPVGNPEFAGDVDLEDPPVVGSGAYNWRLWRVDGDGNGEINLADISPIAVHFSERLDGFRIYRRGPGELVFTRLDNGGLPVLVNRSEANGGTGIDPLRPVRYSFEDQFEVDGSYEYRVVAYDSVSDSEGPASAPGFNELNAVTAVITADVTQGVPPLTVDFDASESTSITGPITDYSWDLDGDSILEEFTGDVPFISRAYNVHGAWLASVQVTNANGESDVASIVISVTTPPTARLKAGPDWLEVPLTVTFDASSSSDTDGEVTGYEWDIDNDGEFELDTGPLATHAVDFTDAGEATVGLRVTDNLGATASTTLSIELVDNYFEQEDNDSFTTGTDLGLLAPGATITDITGAAGTGLYDGDNSDWFRFQLDDAAQVTAQLNFLHSDANLSLGLYGPDSASQILLADTLNDGEQLSVPTLIDGEYYLLVSRVAGPWGPAAEYQLDVEISELVYDELEDNDSSSQPQQLGNIDDGLLPQFIGNLGPAGYDGDSEDWLAFSIGSPGSYRIRLEFFHRAADLELQLYESDGESLIGSSSSVNNGETLVKELAAGAYLIRCYRFEGGNANYMLSILHE